MSDTADWLEQIKALWRVSENVGYPASSLGPWIERFGGVPSTLAEYYTSLGAHRELNETQDALVIPDDAAGHHRRRDVPETDRLVFYVENQWALLWGIAPDAVEEADPAVEVSGDGTEWSLTGDTVSTFLLAQAHMQRVMSFEFTSEEHWDFDESAVKAIRAKFPHILSSGMYEGTDFHGSPEQLVMINRAPEGYAVWFGAESEDPFDDMFAWFEELDESAD